MTDSSRQGVPVAAEQAQTRASLIGFYLSCALVAIGTAFAGGGYLWFEQTWALVAGVAVTATASVTCYTSLRKMRR